MIPKPAHIARRSNAVMADILPFGLISTRSGRRQYAKNSPAARPEQRELSERRLAGARAVRTERSRECDRVPNADVEHQVIAAATSTPFLDRCIHDLLAVIDRLGAIL